MSSKVLRLADSCAARPVLWRPLDHPPLGIDGPQKINRPAGAGDEPGMSSEERDRLALEAYQRGFTEGKAVGRAQAEAEVGPVIEQLSRRLADLATLRSRIRNQAEEDLLKLSIAVARRILRRELTLDPESIQGLIKVALEKLQSRELTRVRVHPDQEPLVRSCLERLGLPRTLELAADNTLQPGDVRFETPHGILDTSVEAQLREIERGFADRLRR